MITLKKIPRFERSLIDLYKKAFPKNERKPICIINHLMRKNKCDFLAIQSGEENLGFFIILKDHNLVLVDYFAIKETARNKGYGKKSLEVLKDTYCDKRIVLEIESVGLGAQNEEMRIRRKRFYERNGFISTGAQMCIYNERMELIYNKNDSPIPDFQEYASLLENVLGKRLFGIIKLTKIS